MSHFEHNNEVTNSLVGQHLGGVPTFATTWLALKHISDTAAYFQ